MHRPYVPASAIARVGPEIVQLNLARSEVERMGWEQALREPDRPDSTPVADQLHA